MCYRHYFLAGILPAWRNINQDPHKPCESIPVPYLACLKVWVIHPNCPWLHKSLFFPRSIIYFSASRTAALSRSYIYKHPSYWSSSFQPISPGSRASVGSWVCGKVISTPRRAAPSILPWRYTLKKQNIIACDTHRAMELFRLEKPFKIIKPNHSCSTTTATTKPCGQEKYSRLLSPSKCGHSTIALSSLCQGLATLLMKKFLLISKLNLSSSCPPWH